MIYLDPLRLKKAMFSTLIDLYVVEEAAIHVA